MLIQQSNLPDGPFCLTSNDFVGSGISTHVDGASPGTTDVTKTILGVKQRKEPKKNCCLYCKKLVSKIVLHIERVHKNEEVVKQISSQPKG